MDRIDLWLETGRPFPVYFRSRRPGEKYDQPSGLESLQGKRCLSLSNQIRRHKHLPRRGKNRMSWNSYRRSRPSNRHFERRWSEHQQISSFDSICRPRAFVVFLYAPVPSVKYSAVSHESNWLPLLTFQPSFAWNGPLRTNILASCIQPHSGKTIPG